MKLCADEEQGEGPSIFTLSVTRIDEGRFNSRSKSRDRREKVVKEIREGKWWRTRLLISEWEQVIRLRWDVDKNGRVQRTRWLAAGQARASCGG